MKSDGTRLLPFLWKSASHPQKSLKKRSELDQGKRELLVRPAAFRAKVIVHELLHLRYPQHGKAFRAVGRAYLARYGADG